MSAEPATTCPRCDAPIAEGARFCPNCGRGLGAGDGAQPPDRLQSPAGSPPVKLTSAEPRIFGVVPPLGALGLGCAGLILGIVLAVMGRLPLGVAAFVLGAVFVAFAIDAARRWPTSAVARLLVRGADGVGSRFGLARVIAGSWSEATREVIRLRRELRTLRTEREREQFELGGAAYRDDAAEMNERRERITQLEEQIGRDERAMEEVVESARERVGRERVAIKPTQPFAVEEVEPAGEGTEEEETREAGREPTAPRPRKNR